MIITERCQMPIALFAQSSSPWQGNRWWIFKALTNRNRSSGSYEVCVQNVPHPGSMAKHKDAQNLIINTEGWCAGRIFHINATLKPNDLPILGWSTGLNASAYSGRGHFTSTDRLVSSGNCILLHLVSLCLYVCVCLCMCADIVIN